MPTQQGGSFGLITPQLVEWFPGQQVDAASQRNEPVDAINRARIQVIPPTQVFPPWAPSAIEFVMVSHVGVVRLSPEITVGVVVVNELTMDLEDPAKFSIAAEELNVLPWPGYSNSLYSPLEKSRFDPVESAPILALVNVLGELYLLLNLKWDLQTLAPNVRFTECPD